MTMMQTAEAFFEACETGKGWQGCAPYCHESASFAARAEALNDIHTLSGYCDWMRDVYDHYTGLYYDIKGFAVDPERLVVLAYGVFHGYTKDDDPQELTEDYVYAMHFTDGRISHMTKIWNDKFV